VIAKSKKGAAAAPVFAQVFADMKFDDRILRNQNCAISDVADAYQTGIITPH
jgi:hypothetical protein